MSTKIRFDTVCDLHKEGDEPATETIRIAMDDLMYILDVCAPCAAGFRDAARPFTDCARRAGGSLLLDGRGQGKHRPAERPRRHDPAGR